MNAKHLYSSAGLAGLASLASVLGLIACGGDSGTSPAASSSSSGASSSSVYVAPTDDPNAPVRIDDFALSVESGVVYLEGVVYVVDSKDSSVSQIDSLVFGVNPSGPKVTTAGTAAGQDEVDFTADLDAKIVLSSFSECGDFTVFVTAYAKGKPVSASAKFSKDAATYCKEVSSSSSAEVVKALSSSTVKIAAQKKGSSIHAVDLDAMKTYTDIAEIAQNVSTIDIIFGVDAGAPTLYTPNAASAISDYASVNAAGAYKGAIYDTELSYLPENAKTSDQIQFNAKDKGDSQEIFASSYYVVTTDKYDATTKQGLFLLYIPTGIGATQSMEVTTTVWSVVP